MSKPVYGPLVSNILAVYHSASAAERIDGLTWYNRANAIAELFAQQYGVPSSTAAALIAVLSPQKHWERNIVEAEKVLDVFKRTQSVEDAAATQGLFCQQTQRAKIARLLAGEDPLTVLTSNKVRAFYQLIVSGGQVDVVCVDGHAINIANNGMRRLGIEAAKKITAKQYMAYADAYREAGQVVGLTGSQMQAVVWVTYRNL